MPDWQPDWEDVVFDHAAAQAAIAECEHSASALDTAFTGVAQADTRLGTDGAWTGRYQREYDTERSALSTDAAAVAEDLRSLAGGIRSAAEDAAAEQTRRESERQRWWDEKRAEDAALVSLRRPGTSTAV
jgi:hypothetical protein